MPFAISMHKPEGQEGTENDSGLSVLSANTHTRWAQHRASHEHQEDKTWVYEGNRKK